VARQHAIVRFIWTATIFLALIGVAVAARRAIVLFLPARASNPRNPAAALDAHFTDHRALTLTHILPALLFMLLGPLQFIKTLRAKHPGFHRWSGRIFLASSAIIGVTGLTLALRPTIGGLDEKSAILLFGSFFLFALAKALWHAMHRDFARHREWMIRGFGIGLAIAGIRPIMGAFFAAAVIQHHTPQPRHFFGTAFWIGFLLEAIVAEVWIRYTRPNTAAQFASPATRQQAA
jgi:uncharacterized membrane protein